MKVFSLFKTRILFLVLSPFICAVYAFSLTHTVAKGETFYSISKKYSITVDSLCDANKIKKTDVLKIGQKLVIPEKKVVSERKYDVYTVQKGDTFYRIAKINGISVDELKKLNNLSSDNTLKIGQKLKIPLTVLDPASAKLPDLPSSDPRNYSSKKGDSSLTWPVKNPVVTYTKGKVSGVQLSATKDEKVTVIRAGTVMFTGNYRGYGNVVFVQSKTGHIYAYTGLGSISVKNGDYLVFGDTLGTAGVDAIKQSPQIQLMVFLNTTPIDPATAPRG